jgi:hypothetical protein
VEKIDKFLQSGQFKIVVVGFWVFMSAMTAIRFPGSAWDMPWMMMVAMAAHLVIPPKRPLRERLFGLIFYLSAAVTWVAVYSLTRFIVG